MLAISSYCQVTSTLDQEASRGLLILYILTFFCHQKHCNINIGKFSSCQHFKGSDISRRIFFSFIASVLGKITVAKTNSMFKNNIGIIVWGLSILTVVKNKYIIRRNVLEIARRIKIDRNMVELYPFESMVQINVGCTGTLIWYKHVLTAAHCLSNGQKLLTPAKNITVSFPKTNGNFYSVKAIKIHLPKAWMKNRIRKFISNDYAVIELEAPVSRKWMPLGVASHKPTLYINYAGYHSNDRHNQLWFSHCMVEKRNKHILLHNCDASKGSSGSGVYVVENNRRKIIGVLSAKIELGTINNKLSANVATRLTSKKIKRICNWIYPRRKCFFWDY